MGTTLSMFELPFHLDVRTSQRFWGNTINERAKSKANSITAPTTLGLLKNNGILVF